MYGEIVVRAPGHLLPGRPVELSPYAARRVQRYLDEEAAATVLAHTHVENASLLVERAIELTGRLSAAAEHQPVHTPLDADRYQSLVDEFLHTAHGTLRDFGNRR